MTRRRHHKAERLSPEASKIIDDGLAAGVPYEEIAERVESATGETIGVGSISRYYRAKWRPHREATEQATLVADRLVDRLGGLDDAELARALKLRTAEALLPALETLAVDKPQALAGFFADLDANRIEDAKVETKNREIDLRFEALEHAKRVAESKLAAARAKAEDALRPGKQRTREELEQAIRELYGITSPSTATKQNSTLPVEKQGHLEGSSAPRPAPGAPGAGPRAMCGSDASLGLAPERAASGHKNGTTADEVDPSGVHRGSGVRPYNARPAADLPSGEAPLPCDEIADVEPHVAEGSTADRPAAGDRATGGGGTPELPSEDER